MTYKIVVCVKQVPNTQDIKWTESNTIQREGLESIINPYDFAAIQLAKNIKFLNTDSEIHVVSMGPLQACEALKDAVAYGCDYAYLLSDKKFSCSDTLATAYTLSEFIKNIIPDYSIVICGQQAVDGDTAQTPSSLAEKLNISQLTDIKALKALDDNCSSWIKETTKTYEEIKVSGRCLIATNIKDVELKSDINGYIKAQNCKINILKASDINTDETRIGLKGSPTFVKKAFAPDLTRETITMNDMTTAEISKFIEDKISKCRSQYEE